MDEKTIQALKQIKDLLDSGVLNQEEFEKEKSKILGTASKPTKSTIQETFKSRKGLIVTGVILGVSIIVAVILLAAGNKNITADISDNEERPAKTEITQATEEQNQSQQIVASIKQQRQSIADFKKTLPPGSRILATFDDDIKHCLYVYEPEDSYDCKYFYRYDLLSKKKKYYKEELEDKSARVFSDAKQRGKYIYIIANNNALSWFNKDIIIKFSTSNESFETVAIGVDAAFKGNSIIYHDLILTEKGECMADWEAETIESYLDI